MIKIGDKLKTPLVYEETRSTKGFTPSMTGYDIIVTDIDYDDNFDIEVVVDQYGFGWSKRELEADILKRNTPLGRAIYGGKDD